MGKKTSDLIPQQSIQGFKKRCPQIWGHLPIIPFGVTSLKYGIPHVMVT